MKKIIKYISAFSFFVIIGLIIFDLLFLPIIATGKKNVFVPDVRNKSMYAAEKILEDMGLISEIIYSNYKEDYIPYTVLNMSPRPFTKVKEGKIIKLTVTGNKKDIILDDFYKTSLNNAKLIINRQGVVLDTIIYEYSNDIAKHYITSQYPKPGKIIKTNDKITLIVSLGNPPNYYLVPNLINLNLSKAKEIISKSGLLLGKIEYEINDEYLNNTILEQSITEGVRLSFPNKIDLIVSKDRNE